MVGKGVLTYHMTSLCKWSNVALVIFVSRKKGSKMKKRMDQNERGRNRKG